MQAWEILHAIILYQIKNITLFDIIIYSILFDIISYSINFIITFKDFTKDLINIISKKI